MGERKRMKSTERNIGKYRWIERKLAQEGKTETEKKKDRQTDTEREVK